MIEGYNDMIDVNTNGLDLGRQPNNNKKKHKAVKLRKIPHTFDDHNDKVMSIVLAVGVLTLFAIWWIK